MTLTYQEMFNKQLKIRCPSVSLLLCINEFAQNFKVKVLAILSLSVFWDQTKVYEIRSECLISDGPFSEVYYWHSIKLRRSNL